LEVPVSELLGAKIETETRTSEVAEQLSRINEQLAIKNRRARRIWKAVALVLVVIVLVNVFTAVFLASQYINNIHKNRRGNAPDPHKNAPLAQS
jgi:putative transcriptional regulator